MIGSGNSLFSTRVPLALIFVTGVMLRLWNLGNYSITADELSTIQRLQVRSFGEAIQVGVVPDFHPAGVQIFLYYYCKLAGSGEWALRLPFFICGVLSLLLVYKIASAWFGNVAGMFTLALCSVSQLFVIYSRLARPYAPGLLFCLLLVWFLYQMSESENKKAYRFVLPAALSMAAAMYTHYLAFFFAGMAGISMLFVMKREHLLPLLLSGLLACLLFLPHLSLTLRQLGYGGVGGPEGWLSAPEPQFFSDFALFVANDSLRILAVVTALFLLLTGFRFHLHGKRSLWVLCVVWALVPPVFAYTYSVKVNPILQMSGLVFSTPFFFMAGAAFLEHFKKTYHVWTIAGMCLLLAGITVGEKHFYQRNFFGEFRALAQADADADKQWGKENITHTLFTESEFFRTYSLKHFDPAPQYAAFIPGGAGYLRSFAEQVQQANTDYFSYGWSNLGNPYEVLDLIREKYPCLVQKKYFFNSEWYLFSKPGKGHPADAPLRSFSFPCDSNAMLHEGNPYGKTFEANLYETYVRPENIVSCEAVIASSGSHPVAELVMEIKREDSLVYWRSNKLDNFPLAPGKKTKVYFASRMPEHMQADDLLRFYLWAHDSTRVRQYSLRVNTFAGNPGLYKNTDRW
jgi:hypothetical protein